MIRIFSILTKSFNFFTFCTSPLAQNLQKLKCQYYKRPLILLHIVTKVTLLSRDPALHGRGLSYRGTIRL